MGHTYINYKDKVWLAVVYPNRIEFFEMKQDLSKNKIEEFMLPKNKEQIKNKCNRRS